MRIFALVSSLLVGCAATSQVEPETACRMVQLSRASISRLGPHDLAELARGTPALPDAQSAYAQQIGALTAGSVGAAALVAGFVMGFAVDPSQPTVRDAGYGLVGGAMGFFALTWILSSTGHAAAERARAILVRFGQGCTAN